MRSISSRAGSARHSSSPSCDERTTPSVVSGARPTCPAPSKRGPPPPILIKAGPTTYMPDFLAWRKEPISGSSGSTQLFSIVAVEVKYRRQPERFLAEEAHKVFD